MSSKIMPNHIQCSSLLSLGTTDKGVFKVLNAAEIERKAMVVQYSKINEIDVLLIDYQLREIKKAFKKDKIKCCMDIYREFKEEDRISIDNFLKLKKIDASIKASDLYSPLYIHIFKVLYFLNRYNVFFMITAGLSYESIDLLEAFLHLLVSFEVNKSKTFFLI